ncbi:MAG TPA: hypothetical protein VJ547_02905 [Candidatus Thermoplasmatota archaeon]|nr:hypothetical protein [Candidatus Thermoplasmatota archaeon]
MTEPSAPRGALLAAVSLVALLLSQGGAAAGFVTGVGASRVAHLADPANGVTVTVGVNETFDSYAANAFTFTLAGDSSTAARSYTVEVAISPDDPDTRASWNATATLEAGSSTRAVTVTVPAEAIKGTLSNTPFRFSLLGSNGTLIDSAEAAIDVRWRSPPADGGLLQLALATTAFWALVFLYALHLHSNERKLRARAEALERSLQGAQKDDPAEGPKR